MKWRGCAWKSSRSFLYLLLGGVVGVFVFQFYLEARNQYNMVEYPYENEASAIDVTPTGVTLRGSQVTALQSSPVVFTTIQLPRQYSHYLRYDNVERMRYIFPDLVVMQVYHAFNETALDELQRIARALKLHVNSIYGNSRQAPIYLGKIGLYATLFTLFTEVQMLKDGYPTRIFEDLQTHEYGKKRKFECLAVIEDDFQPRQPDRAQVEAMCRSLKRNAKKKMSIVRFSQYNSFNLYLIDDLKWLIAEIQRTGITDPFDVYTEELRLVNRLMLFSNRMVNAPGTITAQQCVDITSWNECLDSIDQGCTLKLYDSSDPHVSCY